MNDWYYARGGKQTGPITREALVALARDGGLDPINDLVWSSSMKDWQAAGQVPGIFSTEVKSAARAIDRSNPYVAPSSNLDDPAPAAHGVGLEEIVPGSQPLKPTACVKRSFDLAMRQFGMILLVGIVYIGSSAIVGNLLTTMDTMLRLPPAQHTVYQPEALENGSSLRFFVSMNRESHVASYPHILISNIFSIFLGLGMIRVGLNIVSGSPFALGMMFSGGRHLLTALCATILYSAMIVLGLVAFIVPGIYLAFRFSQYMPAIVDKNLGVLQSLKYSWSITTNNCLNLFGLFLLTIGIILAGFLALLIGLIVAVPVVWLTWMVAFRWMQYGYRSVLDQPGSSTPMLAENP